jgi:hypothetical protein
MAGIDSRRGTDPRRLADRLRARGGELIQSADTLAALCDVAERRPADQRRLERLAPRVRRLLDQLDEEFGPLPGSDDE